jgi:amino acid transporter
VTVTRRTPSSPKGVSDNATLDHGGLQRDALGFPAVLMQSIAQIAPAVGVVAAIAFTTQLAGPAAPSTFAVAFVVALMVAITVGQLAKHIPSAGGLSTYVSVAVSPSAGFVVGWVYSWFAASCAGVSAGFAGYIMQTELQASYGITIGWPIWAVAILATTAVISYRGIRLSGRALIVFTVVEMAILIALAASGFIDPGPGGVDISGLNPFASPDLNGFYLAVIFSIFAFTGWEGAAAIAEESRRPRWAIPRAMAWSVVILGVFFVVCAWGIQAGWGSEALGALAESADNPAFVVAHRIWGDAWILILLCLLNSCLGVSIATTIDATRMWYAMSRAGVMPRYLNYVHPTYHTPSRAVLTHLVFAAVVCLGGGALLGSDQVLYFFGVAATLIYAVVYITAAIGVLRFYRTARRDSFNWLLHVAFPILSIAVLVWVAWKSLIPLPEGPTRYAPLAAQLLIVSGTVIVVAVSLRSRDGAWKQRVRAAYTDE